MTKENSRYAFGTDEKMSDRQAFIAHHNTCPGCKGENGYGSGQYRQCPCGFRWVPPRPTGENVHIFQGFRRQGINSINQ